MSCLLWKGHREDALFSIFQVKWIPKSSSQGNGFAAFWWNILNMPSRRKAYNTVLYVVRKEDRNACTWELRLFTSLQFSGSFKTLVPHDVSSHGRGWVGVTAVSKRGTPKGSPGERGLQWDEGRALSWLLLFCHRASLSASCKGRAFGFSPAT